MKDLSIYADQNQAVCESRDNNNVVKYMKFGDFTEEIQDKLTEGQIWGVYYNENNKLVAETHDGEIYTDIEV